MMRNRTPLGWRGATVLAARVLAARVLAARVLATTIMVAVSVTVAWPVAATPTLPTFDEDLPIPRPDLSAVDKSVRSKVEAMQKRLAETVEQRRRGETVPDLSGGFGSLGQMFHGFRLLDAAETCYSNSRRLAPEDYRWSYYLGLVRNAKGDFEPAVEDYSRALALEPDDHPTLIRLANALLELNRLDEAEQHYRKALELDPQGAVAYFGLGKAAALRGDHPTAIEHFEKAIDLQPEASEVRYPLAQSYRQLGNLDKAREHLSLRGEGEVRFTDPLGSSVVRLATAAAFEIVMSLARDAGSIPEQEFLGFALTQLGDDQGSIGQLEQGLVLERFSTRKSEPSELARIHYVLGGLLVKADRDDEAIRHFRSAIELDDSLIDTRVKLGNALARKERLEEALEAYRGVLTAHPENPAALLKQAAVLQNMGREQEALPLLEKLIEIDPSHSEALVRIGSIHERSRNLEGAIAVYRQASQLDLPLPEAVQIRYLFGNVLRQSGDLDSAQAAYSWIVEADSGFVPALAALAGLKGQVGQFDESAALYRRWVEKEPQKLNARLGEVTALIANDRFLDARDRLEAGLAAFPDNLTLKDVLARHLAVCPDHSVRDGARAVELALEVYQKVPSAESIETLAMAYAQAGRFDEAIEWQLHLIDKAQDQANPAVLARLRGNLDLYRGQQVCCVGG